MSFISNEKFLNYIDKQQFNINSNKIILNVFKNKKHEFIILAKDPNNEIYYILELNSGILVNCAEFDSKLIAQSKFLKYLENKIKTFLKR